MDIRELIQASINKLPDAYRHIIFEQIVSVRKIADNKDRVILAIRYAREWNEDARMSNDPTHWDLCLSCVYCLFSSAFEPCDMKSALHWSKGESAAMAWRHSRDWDKSEDAYYQVH